LPKPTDKEREHDSKFSESMARPNMNGLPHLRARARKEKVMAPSQPPNPKSAQLDVGTSTIARGARTLKGGKIGIPMRIWPTASAHLRLGTLQRK
jgi:hypothetical protein